MRQKLGVALAVAVLALSGARETGKHLQELKSLAGEWSGVWGTLLVYAGTYAEGLQNAPARALVASAAQPCDDKAGAALAARRRARAKQTPRATRDAAESSLASGAEDSLTIEAERIALGLVETALAEAALEGRGEALRVPRLRVAANPAEVTSALAGEFNSAFDAAALRKLAAGGETELLRAATLAELRRQAVVGLTAGRTTSAEREGATRFKTRFVLRQADPPRTEKRRADEGDADAGLIGAVADEKQGQSSEQGEFFIAPPSPPGVLNCETQPRR